MAQFLFEMLLNFLWWMILFPVVWVLSAPFILIMAFFSKEPYWKSVRDNYRGVTEWWGEHGWMLWP